MIRAHLDKERELFAQGIKVLSLFFIDEVAKYRDYDREDTLGEYARVFEEEYERARRRDPRRARPRRGGRARTASTSSAIPVRVDARGLLLDRQEDQALGRRRRSQHDGDDAGQSDDVDAYDLILKDKERLLSFDGAGAVHLLALGAARGLGQPQRLRDGHAQEERQHHLAAPGDRPRPAACRSTSTASGWTTPSPCTTSTS